MAWHLPSTIASIARAWCKYRDGDGGARGSVDRQREPAVKDEGVEDEDDDDEEEYTDEEEEEEEEDDDDDDDESEGTAEEVLLPPTV